MKPISFQYERPTTLKNALDILGTYGGFARPLAGGQSLVPMLNMRLIQPAVLVDINSLTDELEYIRVTPDGLELGALVRYSQLETAPEIRENLPVLGHVVDFIGDRQVRNRGTVGGAISQADPTGEIPLCCVTLGARVVVESADRGRREIPASDFFEGAYDPALSEGELVVAVRFPKTPERYSFTEIGRKHNDFAVVSILIAATQRNGRWEDVRLGMGGVSDIPLGLEGAVACLEGMAWGDTSVHAAIEATMEAIDPPDDVRASAEYRSQLVRVKLRRAIEELQANAE